MNNVAVKLGVARTVDILSIATARRVTEMSERRGFPIKRLTQKIFRAVDSSRSRIERRRHA
jgi:hypothetical protein